MPEDKKPRTHTSDVNTKLQSDFNQRQLNLGYVRRPYYGTEDMHLEIKKLLKKLKST